MKVTQYKALGLSFGTLVDRERGIIEGLRPLAVQVEELSSDARLLGAYRHVAGELANNAGRVSATAFHGQLYQRLAQQLQIVPDWDESVAFSSSSAQWPMFEDAPGALQYLSKFYRLLLIAPPYGIDVQALVPAPPAFGHQPGPAHERPVADGLPAHPGRLRGAAVSRPAVFPFLQRP